MLTSYAQVYILWVDFKLFGNEASMVGVVAGVP